MTESVKVTQADYALAEEVVSAANVVSHDGYYEVDIDAAAKTIAAWNARHQPQEREAALRQALAPYGCDEGTINAMVEDVLAALKTTPAPAEPTPVGDVVSTDEIDQLVGYAAHDDDCAVNVLISSGKCSCGLTDILSRLRGEGE